MKDNGQLRRAPEPSRRLRRRTLYAALIAGAVAACSPTLENHGNIPDPEIVKSVRVGMSNRAQVTEMLGSPSAVATFDKESWYYIGKRTSQFAFLEPELLQRMILVIRFDDKGIVQQVEHLTQEDGRDVQFVERKTPTHGRELTLIEQLVGNVGRFGGS